MFKVMQLNGSQEEVHLACITLKSMLFAYMILSSQVTVVVIFNPLECWNFDEVNYINAFEKLKKKTHTKAILHKTSEGFTGSLKPSGGPGWEPQRCEKALRTAW